MPRDAVSRTANVGIWLRKRNGGKNGLTSLSLALNGCCTLAGYKPVRLLADPQYVRAWPGGSGNYKVAANYAPTLSIQVRKKEGKKVYWNALSIIITTPNA